MMKSFFDEIPIEYEEAALVDGYSRLEAFLQVVLPQAITGIAASAVFSLIASWNEFVYGSILTTRYARMVPPAVSVRVGSEGYEWGRIAATAFLYVLPVVVIYLPGSQIVAARSNLWRDQKVSPFVRICGVRYLEWPILN